MYQSAHTLKFMSTPGDQQALTLWVSLTSVGRKVFSSLNSTSRQSPILPSNWHFTPNDRLLSSIPTGAPTYGYAFYAGCAGGMRDGVQSDGIVWF